MEATNSSVSKEAAFALYGDVTAMMIAEITPMRRTVVRSAVTDFTEEEKKDAFQLFKVC